MPTLAELAQARKAVSSRAQLRKSTKPHADNFGIDVAAVGVGLPGTLTIFVRVHKVLPENFSIGLAYAGGNVGSTCVARVNGDHSHHRNPDGSVVIGPHLHLPLADEMSLQLERGYEPRTAIQLPEQNLKLPIAWDTFCHALNVQPDQQVRDWLADLADKVDQLELEMKPR